VDEHLHVCLICDVGLTERVA